MEQAVVSSPDRRFGGEDVPALPAAAGCGFALGEGSPIETRRLPAVEHRTNSALGVTIRFTSRLRDAMFPSRGGDIELCKKLTR